jgi:hypothetical protein
LAAARRFFCGALWWRLPLLLLRLLLALLLHLLLTLLLDLLLPLLLLTLLLLTLLLDLLLPLLLLTLLLDLLLTSLLDLGLAGLGTGDWRARRRQRLSSGSRQRPSCHRLAGLRRLARCA